MTSHARANPAERAGPGDGAEPSGLEDTVAKTAGQAAVRNGPRFRAVASSSKLGRYQLLDELGAGGMATVYRARDERLDRDVAIKVLFAHHCKRRDVVARFQREARAVAALDHPNILRIHDVGGGLAEAELGGTAGAESEIDPPYIVLELIGGGSLREHLEQAGGILAEVAACIGASLCSALAVAHEAGIIHRDIKPANIMIAADGRLVLADFGVARMQDDDSSLITRTGALIGTPAFMSPEQAQGDPLDARSDLYSLGATLYQVATGAMPFGGTTPKVMWAISRGDLTPPLRRNPAMGRELARVIEAMMATEPDDRYADAERAGAALRELSGTQDEPVVELAAYFSDPKSYNATRRPGIVSQTLERARAAARDRRMPEALALADRVLALEPDHHEALEFVDQLGRRAGRTRLLRAMGLVSALAVVAAAVALLWPSSSASPVLVAQDAAPNAETVIPVDAVEANSPDAGGRSAAILSIAAVDAAQRKKLPGHRSPSRRDRNPVAARRRPDASVPATAASAPDASVSAAALPPDARPAPAQLILEMSSWCNVTIDGRDFGRANRDPIELPPGPHAIECSQGRGMASWRTRITLRSGERRRLPGNVLSPVAVTIQVAGGDGIRLDKRFHKNGARLNLAPDRYRISVVRAGRTVAGRWVTIPRLRRCTLRDQPALGCYAPKP